MKRFLLAAAALCLLLVAGTAHAKIVEIRLTRENLAKHYPAFRVKAELDGGSQGFEFAVNTKARKVSPLKWARLTVADDAGTIASAGVALTQSGDELASRFDVAAKYLAKSKFAFIETPHSNGIAMPGADIYWFYLQDFAAAPPNPERQKNADAKAPPDGIYLVHEKGNGPKVTRNDTGDQIVLGERLTDKLGRATSIHSTSNDNQRLSMSLVGVGPLPQAQLGPHLALLIDGRCFMIYSRSDAENDGTVRLSTVIHGEDALRGVTKVYKIEPTLRKHPGHQFAVAFQPDKESYAPGEPITLKMTIKNVGQETVTFHDGGRQRGPRDNQFGFTAMRGGGWGKAVPDTGDPTNFGGLGGNRTLKPGEVFTKDVRLDKWFQFKDADTYAIVATYRLEFHDPREKPHQVIWDDFATAECVVRITMKK